MEDNIPVPGQQPVYEAPPAQPQQSAPPMQQYTPPPTPIAEPPKPASKFFAGITLMDVIIGTAAITAFGLAIWYFRDKIKNAGIEYPQLRADIDDLKQKIKEQQPAEAQQVQQTGF